MYTNTPIPKLRSNEFEELVAFCRSLTAPITAHDLKAFAAIYQCLKHRLSPEEKEVAGDLMRDLSLKC